jgi:MinD superfamily P-loop ATPase
MKQVVILSGKGGTGKTTITSMLSYEIHQDTSVTKPIFADADVDASNLELILAPTPIHKELFSGGKTAFFHQENCIGCQRCVALCRFDAIKVGPASNKEILIDPMSCEGCGLCAIACPRGAITMEYLTNGEWYHSRSRFGDMFHANLYPGQENSGKLVTQVRKEAGEFGKETNADLLLIDGPPGIGCPVIAATTGVDLAVIVTEPTLSGLHDLERIVQTVEHFNTPALVIINKTNINKTIVRDISNYCEEQNIPIIAEIPFEQLLIDAIIQAQTIQEYAPQHPINDTFHQIWMEVKTKLFESSKENH